MPIGLAHYLTVAAILFTLGIFGIFLNRKNVIIIMMSIELMLLAVNINFVAFPIVRHIQSHEHAQNIPIVPLIDAGVVDVQWSLRLDTLSGVMIVAVTIVSAMVHIYSVGYMAHDAGIPRFFAYLSLFTFFMLMLATANDFVQLFFGWEGVGLLSYLLIGFWYDR